MRIAFAVTEFPLLSETFVLNQITGLLDLGHEVEVQAIHRGDSSLLEGRRPDLLRRTRTGRMPWGRLVRLLRAPRALRADDPEHARALRRTLNPLRFGRNALSLRLLYACRPYLNHSYDVIHCHFGPNGNLAAQVKELGLTKAPLVTTFHGYDLREARRRGGRIWPHLKRQGDIFLAISEYSRRCLVELGFDEDRIVDHPVGIDPERFHFRWRNGAEPMSNGRVRILSVGRMVPEKGHLTGIRAIHELRRRRPDLDVKYRIVGGGPLQGRARNLAGRLGLSDVVDLPGPASREQVAAAMEEADIFLLPSFAEILPVVLMEAQATGLPVVSTDVGATGEIVEEGASGYLVPPGKAAALADRLEHLVDHPEMHVRMGGCGREIVKRRFDVRNLNERLLSIYRSL